MSENFRVVMSCQNCISRVQGNIMSDFFEFFEIRFAEFDRKIFRWLSKLHSCLEELFEQMREFRSTLLRLANRRRKVSTY